VKAVLQLTRAGLQSRRRWGQTPRRQFQRSQSPPLTDLTALAGSSSIAATPGTKPLSTPNVPSKYPSIHRLTTPGTPSVPPLYPLCTPSVPPLYPLCTPSVPPLYPLCTPSVPPQFPLSSPSVPPQSTLCAPSIPPLYPSVSSAPSLPLSSSAPSLRPQFWEISFQMTKKTIR